MKKKDALLQKDRDYMFYWVAETLCMHIELIRAMKASDGKLIRKLESRYYKKYKQAFKRWG